MTANADIIIEQRPGVVKAPAAALRWRPASQTAQTVGGPPGMGGGPPGMGGGRPQGAAGGGARGMLGEQMVKDLDLTADQRRRWSVIQAEIRQKMAADLAASAGDRQAARGKMRKHIEAGLIQLEPLLTPDQKKKLAVLRATVAQSRTGSGGYTSGVVYVLRDEEPTAVPVQVGATDGAFTEIRGGVKPGDLVITGGGPKSKVQARSPFGGSSRPRT
jgi:HlyD family secretion protein